MKYNNTGICPICQSETKIVTYSCTLGTEEEYEDCKCCGYHREFVYGGKQASYHKKDGSVIECGDNYKEFIEECRRDYEKNN